MPNRRPYQRTSLPTDARSSKSCWETSARAFRATRPREITITGLTRSMVLRRNDEQFEISVGAGTPLLPLLSRGLQRIAFVMKTSHRCQCIACRSSSNRSPVRSPKSGIPVLSAPSRPGASATNIILAFQGPFRSVKTRREHDIRGHNRQSCASETSLSMDSCQSRDGRENSLTANW